MKYATAVLAGAAAVKALSIRTTPELVPVTQGFKMKPFLTELVEAVNEGANLTDILTKPAGEIVSVGITDINATVHMGLSTDGLSGLSGGRVSEDDVSRIQSTESSASRVGDNARTAHCSNPKVRVEWRNMQPQQRKAFVNAIVCLWDAPPRGISGGAARNRYEELVWVHQQMVGKVHQSGMFLVWHRYYTHLFGRMLREECGYPGAYPFPWWDETRDAGNFAASGLFTSEYFGALPQINNGQGTCVTNGVSSNLPYCNSLSPSCSCCRLSFGWTTRKVEPHVLPIHEPLITLAANFVNYTFDPPILFRIVRGTLTTL